MASMPKWNEGRFSRIFGDVAVLSRLEHLGKNPRHFEHLVTVGFPEHQLRETRDWYYKDATTAVEPGWEAELWFGSSHLTKPSNDLLFSPLTLAASELGLVNLDVVLASTSSVKPCSHSITTLHFKRFDYM